MSITSLAHEPFLRFMLQIILIVLASRALGLAASRISQPMVVAEIVAGILLGPSFFGALAPATYAPIFAPEFLKVLAMVSQLGLILFMFLVGLELDPATLRQRARASLVIANASMIVPLLMGAALALFLGEYGAPHGHSRLPLMLFMGTAMSITAFPVLARILAEQRLSQTEVGILSLTCAAVGDVAAWCLLAFVVAISRASGVQSAVLTTLLALGYIGLLFTVVRPFLARALRRAEVRAPLSQNTLAAILLALFASSCVTELIGIHALFGAFVFGAILPKDGTLTRELTERLEALVVIVLLPTFFAFSGVRTQLGLLDSWHAVGLCAVVIAVACVAKGGASMLGARAMGYSWGDATAIGILMNTRGLVELIVLNVGLDLGVIGHRLFTIMVVMALVTTLMTTPLVRLSRRLQQAASATSHGQPRLCLGSSERSDSQVAAEALLASEAAPD